jgi:L-alanine-DL-glutamate epimerase-like enolase superfamily enzyme
MPFDGTFWEERPSDPWMCIPSMVAAARVSPKLDDGSYRIEAFFIELESDDGVVGIGGPIMRELAFVVDSELRLYLLGADPIAHERVGHFYRAAHGRKGATMMAISAVDCAVWDLKGRFFNTPSTAAGRSTRTEICVRQHAGYSMNPIAAERARELVGQGYRAMKYSSTRTAARPRWHGPQQSTGQRFVERLAPTWTSC